MASPRDRRIQRSTRLTVAVTLIVVSAATVVAAVLAGSGLLVTLAAFASVVLGAAATKITHSELLQSRRDAAADKARTAQEYARITAERTEENRVFADSMQQKIARRQRLIGELQEQLAATHKKVAETTLKLGQEARRADQAEARLEESDTRAAEAIVLAAELEQEITDLKAELAAWELAAKPAKRQSA